MLKYLTIERLEPSLRAGKSVEQWLTYNKETDYTILKWLRTDKEKDSTYSVAYFESFDDGDGDFVDIYEFSLLYPDEPFGIINSFDSAKDALDFAIQKYSALKTKFVSAGRIQDEYEIYLTSQK
jgi:hypothetical protein